MPMSAPTGRQFCLLPPRIFNFGVQLVPWLTMKTIGGSGKSVKEISAIRKILLKTVESYKDVLRE
jgi:hypothetical protein